MGGKTPWRPSIFMPRWMSRHTLEVLDVAVERLQDISVRDAFREGMRCPTCGYTFADYEKHGDHHICQNGVRRAFRELWDELNGARCPWDSDPWVWVVTFDMVTP